MSIQSQAILTGHLGPFEVLALIEAVTGCRADVRPSHKDSYKTIEFAGPAGVEAVHLFLGSSVAEDYREVTEEPSTFISVQCSPFTSDVVIRLLKARGGFFRRSEQEQWVKIDPVRPDQVLPD